MNYDRDITITLSLFAIFVMGWGILSTMIGPFIKNGWIMPVFCVGNVIMLLNTIHFIKVCICKYLYVKKQAKKANTTRETIF